MAISERFPCSRLQPFGSSKSDYICLDLLFLILKWFPVQTLLVCRTVCKSWKQFIDSTPFMIEHLAQQRPRILLQKKSFEYHLLDPKNRPIYDMMRGPDGIVLESQSSHLCAVSAVQGVICLYDNGNNLFLWNPSIRRHMRIPLSPSQSSACRHTDWPPKYCGFWMDPRTKEFKVVIFNIGDDEKGGSLFSSRDQKWREIPEEEMAGYSGHYQSNQQSPQVLIDGVAHWVATDYHDYCGGTIVYYDFLRDKFGEIVLPRDLRNWGLNINISKWEDSLSIVVTTAYPFHSIGFEQWVYRSGSWSKKALFSPIEGLGRIFCVLDWYTALASNSDEELVQHYTEFEDVLIRLGSRKDRDITLSLKHGNSYLFSFCYDFVESLIFPDQVHF